MAEAEPFSIVPLDSGNRRAAKALIYRVFDDETLLDRLNVMLLGTPLQGLTVLFGIMHQRVFVAASGGQVLGVTGLYEDTDDAPVAVWLGWFCVAPEARGRGIGAALLDFSIAEARRMGKPFLRLYTSTDETERAAQSLYESRGLVVVKKRQPVGWAEEGLYELTREIRLA